MNQTDDRPDILKDCSSQKYLDRHPKIGWSKTIRVDWDLWLMKLWRKLRRKKEDL